MIQVQTPTYPTPSQMESYECAKPYTSTKTALEYQLISGNWAFRNLATPRVTKSVPDTKSVPESLPISENPKSPDTRRLEEYTAQLLRISRRRGGPVDSPQRKPVGKVHAEYLCALSKKKTAVLELAAVQVACEESEAVLLEAYGLAHLKHIRDVNYVTDDPKSATGRYFDAVSGIRFDPLEL